MSAIIEWARVLIVQFVHSETPFSCGVYAFVILCLMPCSAKYEVKAWDIYLLPPSVCSVLRIFPVSFLAHAFHILKRVKASSFVLQNLI